MRKMNRGEKLYLDKDKSKESAINHYLSCRDGIVSVFEYNDSSGYGGLTRLFLCENTKHETISIIRQLYSNIKKEWIEEEMSFDSDSFKFLEGLINRDNNVLGGSFYKIRDYSEV